MRAALPLLLVLVIAASCGNEKPEKSSPLIPDTDTIGIRDGYSGSKDTLHINEPIVLITWPDSLMMEQMKSKDSNEFYTGADDYSFYSSGLMQDADSLGIKNISSSLKYFDFSLSNGKHWILDRTPEDKWWGIYLFNGTDTPEVYTAIEDNKEFLKKYFSK